MHQVITREEVEGRQILGARKVVEYSHRRLHGFAGRKRSLLSNRPPLSCNATARLSPPPNGTGARAGTDARRRQGLIHSARRRGVDCNGHDAPVCICVYPFVAVERCACMCVVEHLCVFVCTRVLVRGICLCVFVWVSAVSMGTGRRCASVAAAHAKFNV
jgi:hypothetical protein